MNIPRVVGVIVVAVSAVMLFTAALDDQKSQPRHTTGTVVEDGIVVTDDGNEWEFESSEVRRGMRVSVDFDTCGTEELTDDKIVSIKPIMIGRWRKEPVMDYRYV